MSDGIEHLDWEVDEGWVAAPGPQGVVQFVPDGWGTVTHFQIVEGNVRPQREFPIFLVMILLAIPFWLLAGYGLYCLIRR